MSIPLAKANLFTFANGYHAPLPSPVLYSLIIPFPLHHPLFYFTSSEIKYSTYSSFSNFIFF